MHTNSIFYSPNMVQFSARSPKDDKNRSNFAHGAQSGYNRIVQFKKENMTMEDCREFLIKLKKDVNNDTVPEFGNFAPIVSNMRLKDDSGLAFKIGPVERHPERKELVTSFLNAKTGGIISRTRIFADKQKLLEYIDTIDEDTLKKNIDDFLIDTE